LPQITLQNLSEVVTLDRALRLSWVKPLEQVVSAIYLGLYPWIKSITALLAVLYPNTKT
jgi:hypothetical protein